METSNYKSIISWALELIDSGRWYEAFDNLKRRQLQNDKDAIAVLSQFYLYGIGVTKDIQLGIELLEQAISLGSAEAAWELGLLYCENDEGINTNMYKAVEIFNKGAALGNENCYGALSECYLYGEGTPVDEEKAFEYGLLAAKAGNVMGMLNVAMCYEDGLGTKQDAQMAYGWYKEYLNYKPSDDFAMLRVAICLADPYGSYDIDSSIEKLNEAFDYANKSMKLGNPEACLIVGWFYEKGEIVQQDFDMAHKYIEIAANKGNEVAYHHLQDFRKNVYGKYYIPEY